MALTWFFSKLLLSPLITYPSVFVSLPLYLHQSHELINGLLLLWELFLQAICHLSLPCMNMVLPENETGWDGLAMG